MYAIVQSGSGQHRVAKGKKFITWFAQSSHLKANDSVTIDKVLGFGKEGSFVSGSPFVDGVVKCKVVRAFKQDKVLVFKKHRRKRYRRLNGHRQQCVELLCEKIDCKATKSKVKAKG